MDSGVDELIFVPKGMAKEIKVPTLLSMIESYTLEVYHEGGRWGWTVRNTGILQHLMG